MGGFEKRREVGQSVREKKPFILCIQETKLVVLDVSVWKSLWGGDNGGFSFRPSRGASRGLSNLWDSTEVEVWPSMSFEHVLLIIGRVVKSDKQFVLLNIYAPCEESRQQSFMECYFK